MSYRLRQRLEFRFAFISHFFAFTVCIFFVAFLFAFAVCGFFVFAAVREFSVACVCACFWAEAARARQNAKKKAHPHPEDDQNARNKHAWKRPAGQNAKEMQACKQRPAKTQKKCKSLRSLPKSLKIWKICRFLEHLHFFCIFLPFSFLFFCFLFCVLAGLCLQACFFLHFGQPAASRRACFLRSGRPRDLLFSFCRARAASAQKHARKVRR